MAILILQGLIVTLLCSIFLFMPSVKSSYWLLTVMTAQLALLVYIGLFAAAICLRYKKPQIYRAYRVPFRNIGMWIVCSLGIATSLIAMVIGFFPPSSLIRGGLTRYETDLTMGIIILCLPPLFICFLKTKKWR